MRMTNLRELEELVLFEIRVVFGDNCDEFFQHAINSYLFVFPSCGKTWKNKIFLLIWKVNNYIIFSDVFFLFFCYNITMYKYGANV